MTRLLKNRWVWVAAFLAVSLLSVNCGMLLYGSARFAAARGELDWNVILMDCCWFLLCILPGVFALAVDFGFGGAYLPADEAGEDGAGGDNARLEPGTRVVLRLEEPAPLAADLQVALEREGEAAPAAVLLERSLAAGERLGTVELAVPGGLEPGSYRLTLRVNGSLCGARRCQLQ